MRIDRILSVLVCLATAGAGVIEAEQPSRIHEHHISPGEKFTLSGTVHPMTARAADAGPVDSSLALPSISLHFQLTAAQEADLDRLLKDQQDRNSPQFHKWLTPQQYADRFGLSTSDLNKVVAWLQSEGFTNIEVAPSRTFVTMTGNASQVQGAFEVSLHRLALNGELHYANVNEPRLPKALNGIVLGVRGLNDFRPHPRGIRALPRFTDSNHGYHFMVPADFATIYDLNTLYSSGIDGTGVSIAVVGQSDIALSDIEAFRLAAGLPPKDPTIQLYGKDPGTDTGSAQEADLDLEWAGAVAPNANIIYVNSSDAFNSLQQAIVNNLAPVITVSYGECEPQSGTDVAALEPDLRQANAQGITILAPTGDSGAADCDRQTDPKAKPIMVATKGMAVDYPGSSRNVTAVGGTEFTDFGTTYATQYWAGINSSATGASALSYIPEQAWNETDLGEGLAASGGGASTLFTKPSWQKGTGVPADGKRDVPDVALTASAADPALICDSGWCINGFQNSSLDYDAIGGTSLSTPSFAGIVALVVQKAGIGQGNINTVLYPLAQFSSDAFHDITFGSNVVPCTTGTANCTTGSFGFAAGTGYDQVSGLGSVDGTHLVQEWPDFQFSLTPAAVTIAAGTSANIAVAVTRTPVYAGSVNFTCSSSVSNVTCTAPGSVTTSGSTTLTISRASSSSLRTLPVLFHNGPTALGCLFLMCIGTVVAVSCKRRTGWAVAGFAVVALAGCGGGSSSPAVSQTVTPAPTSATITLSATSGGVWQQSATVAVTLP